MQCSDLLRFQARAGDRFADLAVWIASHWDGDLSVERLAARLERGSIQQTLHGNLRAVPEPSNRLLRLEAAREYLTATPARVESIAATVGFRSDDAFRRAFYRGFGISPSEYRSRFSTG